VLDAGRRRAMRNEKRTILAGQRQVSISLDNVATSFSVGIQTGCIGELMDTFEGSRNEMARIPCKSVASLDNCRAPQFQGW
jgi:hypothetical protein